MALRRLATRGLHLRPLCPLSVSRSFNTNSQMARVDHDEQDEHSPVSRRQRRSFPGGFLSGSEVFDPFTPTRSVSQLMNLMDQLVENPMSTIGGGGARRGWDIREDEDALHIKVDMPGLGKEDVKISVDDNNTLTIKGEGEKESEDEEQRRRYSSRIDLTPNMYKIDGIKAEMKNGVLKLVVPKLKYEDRKDVFQIEVN